MPKRLRLETARRIALAAQGFARPRPAGRVTAAHVRRAIERQAVLQIDYVNVLVPAHALVLFSRLGPYDRSLLDRLVFRDRTFLEHWAHAASIVPAATWPLLAHRRDEFRSSPRLRAFLRKHATYVDAVLETVRTEGPISADDLDGPVGVARHTKGVWRRSIPRIVLEHHFGHGRVAVAGRGSNLARSYDLPERIVAAEHRARTVPRDEAQRSLLEQAARAHGVATAVDLADYWRMSMRDARPRLAELVRAERLIEAEVEGVSESMFLHPSARAPRAISTKSLLSPFDPVVWTRTRGQWLFDFDYTLEIFLPEHRRRHGYYVLPFLWNERLAARVDLAADRKQSILEVRASHLEAGVDRDDLSLALARELRTVARWLRLNEVRVRRRGRLAGALGAALREVSA